MDVVRTFRAVATVSRWRTTTLVASICASVTSQTGMMIDHFGPCTAAAVIFVSETYHSTSVLLLNAFDGKRFRSRQHPRATRDETPRIRAIIRDFVRGRSNDIRIKRLALFI